MFDHPDDIAFFASNRLTLEEIRAAGWHMYYSSGGGWWWTNETTGRHYMPPWIRQLVRSACERNFERGKKAAQECFREALGMKPRKAVCEKIDALGLPKELEIGEAPMAALDDVTHWMTYGGITHIIAEARQGWCYTLCGSMCTGTPETTKPQKLRLCSECRSKLKTARKAEQEVAT
jgi:hypothetical protein